MAIELSPAEFIFDISLSHIFHMSEHVFFYPAGVPQIIFSYYIPVIAANIHRNVTDIFTTEWIALLQIRMSYVAEANSLCYMENQIMVDSSRLDCTRYR